MAVSEDLEDAIVARVQGLGLALDGVAATVQGKKAPKIERGLEATPLIQVTAAEQPVGYDWLDTGTDASGPGRKTAHYPVEITMSAPGDRNPTEGSATYRDWRQAIMRAFEPPSVLGVEELWYVDVDPGPQYDRAGFTRNYDQSVITLVCVTIETAGGT